MLASMKMSEAARSKRTASSLETARSAPGSSTIQQQQPLPPPQKRIRFTGRVRPLGELLDSFPTDEHLIHALTRPATVDDYGGPEALIQQLINLALMGSGPGNVTPTSAQPQQNRLASEVALRALRLIVASRCPIFTASIIQTVFERCLAHAESIVAQENSLILCSNLLTICAECAKSVVVLQQHLISSLVDILGKSECDFLLLTESLRVLSRFFARESASRHLARLSIICVDLLMIGDVRVRLAALDLLNEMIGRCSRSSSTVSQIPIEALYKSVIQSLDDPSEDIRLASLSVISLLGSLRPDLPMEDDGAMASTSKAASTTNTLANVVFSRLCHACASDRMIRVRALAALLIGQLPGVSENFIEQSLDKKTIASMRVDGEQQQQRRAGYSVATGDYEVDAVSLISQSACGALVHALEDEFYEVREAGVESLSRMITPERMSFARQGQDFLIDALGDEVESVVLCALRALARAGSQLDFTEKHVSAILFTLKVASSSVRRQVHRTLSSIFLRSRASHLACCLALFENIRMFPSDVDSIWACCARFGRNHSQLTRSNLSRLLDNHPMFMSQEAKMDDPAYIAKLLIIFAAAGVDGTASQIVHSLPQHVRSHYGYISSRFRHLLHETGILTTPSEASGSEIVRSSSGSQLRQVLVRHVELLRNSLIASPSLERSINLATNLIIRNSSSQPSNSTTALARVQNTTQFDSSDRFAPHWRFLTGIVHCLFDYNRARQAVVSAAISSADASSQVRSILNNDLRPRISRLINCFMPVPADFIALLRLIDLAASVAGGIEPALLHRISLLARSSFVEAAIAVPNVIEVFADSETSGTENLGSQPMQRLSQFDEAIINCLIACLSSDEIYRERMTELRVEIREPAVSIVSEPAAEVRFVSHFGATVPLRFNVTGFPHNQLSTSMPRLLIRVTYPNLRSDLLAPLASDIEVLDDDEPSSSESHEIIISVGMRIPIAFQASTGPFHARVSILLSTVNDGLVDLTVSENGTTSPLQLLVHSKSAKGEMQKRLMSAAQP